MGYRTANSFEDRHRRSSESGQFNALGEWRLPDDASLSLSGGVSRHDIEARGPPDRSRDVGLSGFMRADLKRRRSAARAYWNAGRTMFRDIASLGGALIFDYDTYDLELSQGVALPADNDLVFGLAWRRNDARSQLFTRRVTQDLLAGFAENQWRASEHWTAVASLRLDHHEHAGWFLSPRASLIFSPNAVHTFRGTAGLAFRNPTLLENHIQTTVVTPGLEQVITGSFDIRPERLQSFELSHAAELGRVRTTLTGFQYALRDIVSATAPALISAGPPQRFQFGVTNSGATRAIGAEAAVEGRVGQNLTLWSNYSYQSLKDELPSQTTAGSAPKHKANAGARVRRGPWTSNLWGHWVARTLWRESATTRTTIPDYFILNAFVGWAFSGRLEGFELGLGAFNLLDAEHYELAPFQDAVRTGQGGELMRRRLLMTARWRF